MKLIMWLTVMDSTFQYLLIMQFYICKFKLNEVFAYTVFYEVSDYAVT